MQTKTDHKEILSTERGPHSFSSASVAGFEIHMGASQPENFRELVKRNADRLSGLFHLSPEERELLVRIARYQMESDHNGAGPFSLGLEELQLVTPTAGLRRYGLVEVSTSDAGKRRLQLPEKVLDLLLGSDDLDPYLIKRIRPPVEPQTLPEGWSRLAREIAAILTAAGAKRGDAREMRIEITGADAPGLLDVSVVACRAAGLSPYILRITGIVASPLVEAEFLTIWNRDARIQPLAAVLELTGEESPETKGRIFEAAALLESPLLILSPSPTESRSHRTVHLELPELSMDEQKDLWSRALSGSGVDEKMENAIHRITNHFRLKPAQILESTTVALAKIEGEAADRGDNAGKVADELWRLARNHTRPRIHDLASRIEPVTTLDDLAMDGEGRHTLEEIIQRIRHNATVLHGWGFEKKHSRGLGTTALFYGESGTGKTHAAEAIAGELGLDLYRIDLSRVISKYIGETEKHLGRIYDEAKNSGAVLLFDEADALFGKRSEITDAHDRYANQEISYLLQKMEEYQGLSILTTNLESNMDDAFKRRITYRIAFRMPEVETRKRIWQRIFPEEAPLYNLNYDELAALELTGGEIKNMALRAACIAASHGDAIKMKYIHATLKEELAKVGLFLQPGEFGAWLGEEMN